MHSALGYSLCHGVSKSAARWFLGVILTLCKFYFDILLDNSRANKQWRYIRANMGLFGKTPERNPKDMVNQSRHESYLLLHFVIDILGKRMVS